MFIMNNTAPKDMLVKSITVSSQFFKFQIVRVYFDGLSILLTENSNSDIFRL